MQYHLQNQSNDQSIHKVYEILKTRAGDNI